MAASGKKDENPGPDKPRRSLTELSGIMTREEAEDLAKAIEDNRRRRMGVRRRELGLGNS